MATPPSCCASTASIPASAEAALRAGGRGRRAVDEEGQLVLFEGAGEEIPAPAPRLRELVEIPAPPLARVARLSYSAISLFDRCGYRYYAERVVGMKPAPVGASGRRRRSRGGLHPTEIGDAVHRLLELVDLAAPAAPAARSSCEQLVRGWYPDVSEDEVRRIERARAARTPARRSPPGSRGCGASRPERPFAFELDGVLVNGRLDVLWLEGERALVLDYKTNPLLGRDPAEIVEEEYVTQQIVYAVACLRAGRTEVEVVYHFLEEADAVVSTMFTADDAPRLEAGLSASIARIRAGEFRPTPSPFACSGCPALDVVCAGPRLGGPGDSDAPRPCSRRRSSLPGVRVAALYDVHGNLPALEAVLADPRVEGADLVVCGGDLVAGPRPAACLDLLAC